MLGGVLLSFALVMALVAADRAAKQAPADGPKEKAGNVDVRQGDRRRQDRRIGKPAQGARHDRPGVGSLEIARRPTRTRRRPASSNRASR